jgi:hypothetical protein
MKNDERGEVGKMMIVRLGKAIVSIEELKILLRCSDHADLFALRRAPGLREGFA